LVQLRRVPLVWGGDQRQARFPSVAATLAVDAICERSPVTSGIW